MDKKLNDLATYIHNLREKLAPLNPDNGHALVAIRAENAGEAVGGEEHENLNDTSSSNDVQNDEKQQSPNHWAYQIYLAFIFYYAVMPELDCKWN